MTDRELLELAAKAYQADNPAWNDEPCAGFRDGFMEWWNPLTDSGDALRLAVKLNLSIRFDSCTDGAEVNVGGEWDDAPEGCREIFDQNGAKATRRAIVRAAAEIGRTMP